MKYFSISILFFSSILANSHVLAQAAIFVFAHPDDEVIANGTIRHLVKQGIDVHVAYTTSGKYGRDVRGIIIDDPDSLAEQRENEATDALAVVGIQTSNIHFLKMDDYGTDVYKMAGPLQKLFDSVNPSIVITFGPDGIYGHKDHRSLSPVVSYLFNNSINSMVLLYASLSETRDEGYGFTKGKGKPELGNDIVHRVADKAINYQLDISSYSDYQKKSLSKYVSQFSAKDMTLMNSFYDNAICPGKTHLPRCEQYIIARIKPGYDHKYQLGLLGFYADN